MGTLGIIGGLIGLVGSIIGGMGQAAAAERQARAQERRGAITTASERVRQRATTRRGIREVRVRRAKILQASENTGTIGSSGQMGAVAALSTNLGFEVGQNKSGTLAAQGITRENQNIADAQAAGQQAAAFGNLISSVGGLFR